MGFLVRIQKLSEQKRKMILWAIVATLAIIFIIFWFKNFSARLKEIDTGALGEEFSFPEVREELENLPPIPEFEIPEGLISSTTDNGQEEQ